MKKQRDLCLLALIVFNQFCWAGDSSLYAGFSVGNSRISFDHRDFGSNTPGNAFDRTTAGSDAGYKLFVGYGLNDFLALEAGYMRQGEFQFRSTNADGLDSVFDFTASSLSLALKATLPLAEKLAVFGKLGLSQNTAKLHYWRDSSRAQPLPLAPGTVVSMPNLATYINPSSYCEVALAPMVGVGIEYALLKDVKLRMEYENYGRLGKQTTTGRTGSKIVSLGISYLF